MALKCEREKRNFKEGKNRICNFNSVMECSNTMLKYLMVKGSHFNLSNTKSSYCFAQLRIPSSESKLATLAFTAAGSYCLRAPLMTQHQFHRFLLLHLGEIGELPFKRDHWVAIVWDGYAVQGWN